MDFFRRLNIKLEREEKEAKIKFFEELNTKFDRGLIEGQSDVEVLKNAIERETDTDFLLSSLLEDYLVHLNKHDIPEPELSKRYHMVKDIVDSENLDKPFEDVPEEERRLLIGLRAAIEVGDKNLSLFNLNEISSLITARSANYERAMDAVNLSRPLAIIGIVASVILGILALST